MSVTSDELIRLIHASPIRMALAVTGGGIQGVADLLRVPGASRTVLEVLIPYSDSALRELLGGRPDQASSAQTARAMAMAALLRARRYQADDPAIVLAGISCTASLATDRIKRGPHRVHLAMQTDRMTTTWSVELSKGARSRVQEDDLASGLLLNLVAEACALPEPLDLPLAPGECLQRSTAVAEDAWRDLLLGRVDVVRQAGPGEGGRPPAALLPGAFNPLHAAHRRMAELAQEVLAVPVEFELSILNVDKPPLDYEEMRWRIAQFSPTDALWLTRAPTFDEKSARFPGVTFVVGADTLWRIAEPRYYRGDASACEAAIQRIAARACRFLVFGRLVEGRFLQLRDLDLPPTLRALCTEVPAERFRMDISSTALRRGSQ